MAAWGLAAMAAGASAASPASALRARHAALADALSRSAFQQPLHLESSQTANGVKGEVYAVIGHPFGTVSGALHRVEPWCDILILHLNVKRCQAFGSPRNAIALGIGKKVDQPASDAHGLNFSYRVAANAPDYMKVQLDAGAGPLGTRDYRIVVEAIPLDAGHSFMHMSYAYGYGFAARMAMQVYLGTVGSAKVGFSVVGRRGGQPVYVDSLRGMMERNTMRYYLAIDTYLDSLSVAQRERQAWRLREWFAATERYPQQLHEISEAEYLAMKHREIARQQASTRAARPG
jgi:hypothetical protein